jgi:hypothetical protein
VSRWFTKPYAARIAAWTTTIVVALGAAVHVARMPRRPPVVSDALYDAGIWTRAHLPGDCIDYLVANGDTAYWLHLAVLGNARGATRSLNSDTYEPQRALVRWILPEGLPYAIVEDLDALPRDIREHVIVVGRFGRAAIVQRPGRPTCIP